MHVLRAWGLYLVLVFAGGAFLAPALYLATQAAADSWPAFADLAGKPFHRYVNRSLLFLALAGLWPLCRYLGLKSWRDVGFHWSGGYWRESVVGAALGVGTVLLLAGISIGADARHLKVDMSMRSVVATALGAVVAGMVVGAVEEALFRGALMGTLSRRLGWVHALWASSAIYAWVHFFSPVEWTGSVEWNTGWIVLRRMLGGFVDLSMLVPGFAGLFLAGIVLGTVYHRTGRLHAAIGMHAGWIFSMKMAGALTRAVPTAESAVWGTDRLVDGWIALGVLGLLLLAVPAAFRRAGPSVEGKA